MIYRVRGYFGKKVGMIFFVDISGLEFREVGEVKKGEETYREGAPWCRVQLGESAVRLATMYDMVPCV